MCEAEGDEFWFFKGEAFVEEAVEIDVEGAAVVFFEEDVFAVAVAEAEDVPDDGHDGAGTGVAEASGEPGAGFGKHFDEPFVEDGGKVRDDFFCEDGELFGSGDGFCEELAKLYVIYMHVFLLVAVQENLTERFEVIDPFDQTAFLVEGRYCVSLDIKATFAGLGIFL